MNCERGNTMLKIALPILLFPGLLLAQGKPTPKKEVVFKRVIGGIATKNSKDKKIECIISKDDKGLNTVTGWQEILKKSEKSELRKALLFVAVVPSKEYYGYIDGKEVLLSKSHDSASFREEAQPLIKHIDRLCGGK